MSAVPNGDFETGSLAPWTAMPPGAATVSPLFPQEGRYAAQLTATTIGSAVTLTSSSFSIQVANEAQMIGFAYLGQIDYRQS